MNKKITYTSAPKSIAHEISNTEKEVDFLPSPENLVKRNPKIKVTISLSSQSIEFFKKSAKKNKVKYQTMINEVLDQYARHYNSSL